MRKVSADSSICRFVVAEKSKKPARTLLNDSSRNDLPSNHFIEGGYFYAETPKRIDLTGTLEESITYSPYGIPSSSSTLGNPYLFTGREYDQETGLYYYRARYYNPRIGRFLQKDPLTWGPNDPRILNIVINQGQLSQLNSDSHPISSELPMAQIFSRSYKLDEIVVKRKLFVIQGGIEQPLLFNSYLYAFNTPTTLIDPMGTYVALPPITNYPTFEFNLGKYGKIGKAILFAILLWLGEPPDNDPNRPPRPPKTSSEPYDRPSGGGQCPRPPGGL